MNKSHMNGSCRKSIWVMSHVNESCHKIPCRCHLVSSSFMSHVNESFICDMNEVILYLTWLTWRWHLVSYLSKWLLSSIWVMSHVNESCHKIPWRCHLVSSSFMSHVNKSFICDMNEDHSYVTWMRILVSYMTHMEMSSCIWVNECCHRFKS